MLDVAAQRPRFTPGEAIRIAHEQFGRVVLAARELPSDRDQNFHLQEASGAGLVLKIAGAAEAREVLELQNGALQHLAAQPRLAASFPRVCANRHGETIGQVADDDGRAFYVRLLTFLPGVPLALVNPQTPALLHDVGRFLGEMDEALDSFTHPAMERSLHWDLQHAASTIRRYAPHTHAPERQALVASFLARFEDEVLPRLPELRRGVIHNDGNDHNLLVSADPWRPRHVVGLIDFGDMVHSCAVFEVAVAAAYIMLDKRDPVAAAAQLIAGYHGVRPLSELELALLPTLIATRLCTSVALSAYQQAQEPHNPYLSISERPAWTLLEQLAGLAPSLLHYTFRAACGLEPYPQHGAIVAWLRANQGALAPVVPADPAQALVLDWSVGSPELPNPAVFAAPQKLDAQLSRRLQEAGASLGIGRYDEARLCYTGEAFREPDGTWRTLHIGLDLFLPSGTPVYAPLDGTVHSFAHNDAPLDYGPTIILEHDVGDGLVFYTLYGHLSLDSLDGLAIGAPVTAGEQIGRLGDATVNGGWPPHLHLQLIGDLLGRQGEFPGVASPNSREVWLSLCPDPNLLVGVPAERFPAPPPPAPQILATRQEHLGPSLSLSYQQPLHIVRGWRQYLYDQDGRAYLDVVNNVCHVGHGHPRVVAALSRQAAVLNTNTRYLHPNIVRFAGQLLATLPAPLEVCFFVCSGSEANELALRLARTYTGGAEMIVIDGAYHGNTAALIDISPYKHNGPGGSGPPPHVHAVPMPDPYRGPYKGYGPETGRRYAAHVAEAIAALGPPASSRPSLPDGKQRLAAFIAEPLLGCGGQIVLPDGYLAAAFDHVRAAGGVCIVDEVQVGFGRAGSAFWGFETQGVVPDIVTMGKPIGNGHPLGAVVTTHAIADAFANGMEYFNTFGGNPVSCAVGSAVLEVIAEEGLQAHAQVVGEQLLTGLRALQGRHALIGDVRGLGLFVGVELVRDPETLEPAATEATYIVERMKEEGILLSIDGPLHNVLKLKPPLVFDAHDAARLVATLDRVLAEDPLRELPPSAR